MEDKARVTLRVQSVASPSRDGHAWCERTVERVGRRASSKAIVKLFEPRIKPDEISDAEL